MAASAISELFVFIRAPVATAVAPPELAGVFASAPLKTGVPIYELFVCPDEVKETVRESPVLPILALEADHESVLSWLRRLILNSACPVKFLNS